MAPSIDMTHIPFGEKVNVLYSKLVLLHSSTSLFDSLRVATRFVGKEYGIESDAGKALVSVIDRAVTENLLHDGLARGLKVLMREYGHVV